MADTSQITANPEQTSEITATPEQPEGSADGSPDIPEDEPTTRSEDELGESTVDETPGSSANLKPDVESDAAHKEAPVDDLSTGREQVQPVVGQDGDLPIDRQQVILVGTGSQESDPEDESGGLSLDVLPDAADAGVVGQAENLQGMIKLQQLIMTIGVVGKYMYLTNLALAREPAPLIKVQNVLFNVLKLVDAASLMLQTFQSGANNMLEKLKIAYLYLLDGFEDFAKTDVEATKKDVDSMRDKVEKVTKDTKKLKHDVELCAQDTVKKIRELEQQVKKREGVKPKKPGSEPRIPDQDNDTFKDLARSDLQFRQLFYILYTVLVLNTLSIISVVVDFVFHLCLGHPLFTVKPNYSGMVFVTFSLLGVELVVSGLYVFHMCFRRQTALVCSGRKRFLLHLIHGCILLDILLVFLLQILGPSCNWWSQKTTNLISVLIFAILVVVEMAVSFLVRHKDDMHMCAIVHTSEEDPPSGASFSPLMPATANIAPAATTTAAPVSPPRPHIDDPTITPDDLLDLKKKLTLLKLTNASLNEAVKSLDVCETLLANLMPIIEGWRTECVDVLEPALDEGIRKAEGLTEEQKKSYWNSVMFKTEVMGYYTRWRALQVYATSTRSKAKATRREIEAHYTDNPLPHEAELKAWQIAEQDTLPDIVAVVRENKQLSRDVDH